VAQRRLGTVLTLFPAQVDTRYLPIKPLGKGAYGVVCSATHRVSVVRVDIKKIGKAYSNATDARRTLGEIQLLRHLHHENVVVLRDVMQPPSLAEFNDVYLVYELMDTARALTCLSQGRLTRCACRTCTKSSARRSRSLTSTASTLCTRRVLLRDD
jgi:hypothetical protein